MKLSQAIKPISYLKTHAAEMIRLFAEDNDTFIITQNGEAKAVLLDINTYEETQESLALLKILAESALSIEKCHTKPIKKAFSDIRQQSKELSKENGKI